MSDYEMIEIIMSALAEAAKERGVELARLSPEMLNYLYLGIRDSNGGGVRTVKISVNTQGDL